MPTGEPSSNSPPLSQSASTCTARVRRALRVCVRVRPPLERELGGCLLLRPDQVAECLSDGRTLILREILSYSVPPCRPQGLSRNASLSDLRVRDGNALWRDGDAEQWAARRRCAAQYIFTFDRVFGVGATQEAVYESMVRPAVRQAKEGFSSTIFAYGQTGAGKTYTMEGILDRPNHPQRGICPRAVADLFALGRQQGSGLGPFRMRVSFVQIYNEVVTDLLQPSNTNLPMREDKRRGVFVDGLSEWPLTHPQDIYRILSQVDDVRPIAPTTVNDRSSRSHTMLTLQIDNNSPHPHPQPHAHEPQPALCAPGRRGGRLHLVDLAGSERVRLTGATGVRLEESKRINQSLAALGNVVMALTHGRKHVPYRDSKLTRLLQDSLGGWCITTLIACIAPTPESFGESLSTLKFALRSNRVHNEPQIQIEELPWTASMASANMRHVAAGLRQDLTSTNDAASIPSGPFSRAGSRPRTPHEGRDATSLLGMATDGSRSRCPSRRREREGETGQVNRYRQLLMRQRETMAELASSLAHRDEKLRSLQHQYDSLQQEHLSLISQLQPAPLAPSRSVQTVPHTPSSTPLYFPGATRQEPSDIDIDIDDSCPPPSIGVRSGRQVEPFPVDHSPHYVPSAQGSMAISQTTRLRLGDPSPPRARAARSACSSPLRPVGGTGGQPRRQSPFAARGRDLPSVPIVEGVPSPFSHQSARRRIDNQQTSSARLVGGDRATLSTSSASAVPISSTDPVFSFLDGLRGKAASMRADEPRDVDHDHGPSQADPGHPPAAPAAAWEDSPSLWLDSLLDGLDTSAPPSGTKIRPSSSLRSKDAALIRDALDDVALSRGRAIAVGSKADAALAEMGIGGEGVGKRWMGTPSFGRLGEDR
ncbi:unnamed protein product [Vitrella brassicaformis CCMP3155]|uniref:Kinesin-like protein n=2 Tax=Vitrella brassicaformis TaxID=1169539 RepID=A0A0G4EAQ5_VITBC|nr:unnamed protein product [Vitrella brassicaformis CCMP3155]|eukprot:CEL92731.1 unnamed protein product [Vitrella brassicaformis CCMP3155]